MKLRLKSPTWREKRNSVRLPLSGKVSCCRKERTSWFRVSSAAPFFAEMTQPSMFGLRLETETPVEKGEDLLVKVDGGLLGGTGEVELFGTVAWKEPATESERIVCGIQLKHNKADFKQWAAMIRGRLQELDPTRKGAELNVSD